ncbi:minor capsid protein [Mesorhizobium sp. M0152]|uniref:ADP-ribosyltransferase n=1 Tax=Mesorhizobium sp. M0152 TaxID=2956898 RepID=UPI003336AD6F
MPNAVAHNLLVQHRIGLERYGVALNKKILSKLNKAEANIVAKIAAMPALDATTAGPSSAARQHLETLLSQIRATAVEAMAVVNSTVETELGDLAVHEVEWAAGTYKASLPFATNFVTPSPQLLKAIVTTRPLQGRYIKDWLLQYPDQIKQKVHDAVLIGVMEGESVSDITRRIRGTRALNYGDGALRGTKRGVEALVRTAVNHVSNAAHKTFLDDNADVFDRYQWLAVLDARTTPVCRSRAGAVYTNSPNSTNPIPPAHINCRSTIAPIVIGQEVDAVNDYAKWLADQPDAVQMEVLGPTKQKLWKDGRITLDKFVADSGRPLTLEQLKASDAAAWKRAFGEKTAKEAALNPGAVKRSAPPAPIQTEAAKSTKKAIAAAKVQIVETAAEIAAKKAALAEAAKQLALENAAKLAKEAAEAKKTAALTRIDAQAENGTVALSQPSSAPAASGYAKLYAGANGQLAKSGGEIAQVALSDIEIVYGGSVQADAVKALIEKFDPSVPVYGAKVGDKFHLIEGKTALKAAEALKEPTIKFQYIDATKAIEAAKAASAKAAEEQLAAAAAAAEAKKLAKAMAASKKAGQKITMTDQEVMTIKHEIAQGKDGGVFYKLKTADHEYFSWAGRHYNDVTSPEQTAIDQYKGSTYRSINAMLREHKGDRRKIKELGGETARKIANMDKALMRNQAPVDMQGFRGFDLRHTLKEQYGSARVPAGFKVDDLRGVVVSDDGYMSFSVRERAAAGFANGSAINIPGEGETSFVMEAVFKKGTPMLRGTDYEQEIITRGTQYRVVGVRDETDYYKTKVGTYAGNRVVVLEVEEVTE